MKITIVQGAFFPVPPLMGGAVEKIWYALGAEFARRGHEVTHISRLCSGLPREEELGGVRHIRVPGFDAPRSLAILKGLDLLYSLRVLPVLPKADILVTHTFWLPMLARRSRWGKLYVHAARYPKGQMRFYAHAARIQTVSSPIREAILREVPHLAEKVCCIPNPLPGEAAALPPQPSAPGGKKQVLYVGRVHPEKGLELLLDAWALLSDAERAGWKLVVVGPAEAKYGGGGEPFLARLQKRGEGLGVEWAGPVFDPTRLHAYYRNASLFVYPSLAEKGETFGLAPLEAMAQGCPAVVSALGCFRDFIEDGVNGWIFDHRCADPARALAARLRERIAAPTCPASVAQRARETADAFSLKRVAGLYLEDFQSLLGPPIG